MTERKNTILVYGNRAKNVAPPPWDKQIADLEAEVDRLRTALAKPKVKPLVWEGKYEAEVAKCFHDMEYCVVSVPACNGAISWRLQRRGNVVAGRLVDTFAEAKAAAQADYERRILSALEGE